MDVRHRHRFGPWSLKKVGPRAAQEDSEYMAGCRFPPVWVQSCECGHEHWYRSHSKPLASLKFREMQRVRVL